MKVFAIEGAGQYCWGCSIVAATSFEQAIQLATEKDVADNSSELDYLKFYDEPTDVNELPVSYVGEPAVLYAHKTVL